MIARLSVAVLISLAAGLLQAQLNRGALNGTVADPAGAAVPGAKVIARNMETNVAFETQSAATGEYALPGLPSGVYTLSGEAPGFKRTSLTEIRVSVGEVLRVDLRLQIGNVAESIEVTAEVPRLQTDTPDVGNTLSNKSLLDLPLSFGDARTAESFAYKITPGVSGGTWKSSINGSTAFSKETLLDGVTVTTNRAGHFGESSVSVEALQEFRVQTSGMSAEYGRAQGGVFNYVMKSGTNSLHGSGFFGLRNEVFNANSFANNARGAARNLDRRLSFAGSVGGPVVLPGVYHGANKTFFYSAYERFRQRQLGFASPNATAPLPEFLDGDFSRLLGPALANITDALGRPVLRGAIYDPQTFLQLPNGRWIGEMFPGNRVPTSRFSQVSRNVVAMLRQGYLPRVREASGLIPLANNAYRPAVNNPIFDQHQFSTKLDHFISSSHKLSGSISFTKRPRTLLDQVRLWNMDDPMGGPLASARQQVIKSYLSRVSYDWTATPTILNTLSVYYNLTRNTNDVSTASIDGAAKLGIRNLSTTGYPDINFGGGPFVPLTNIGDPQTSLNVSPAYGLVNTVSWSRNKHLFKMGVDFRDNRNNTRGNPGGGFTFAARGTAIPNEAFSGSQTGYSFASFLLGIVDTASLSDPAGLGGRRKYIALFVQDDWKATSRLTLNLGLRWEYQPPMTEHYDRLASWNPDKVDPESGLRGAYEFAGNCQVCTGKSYFGTKSFRDFGPRFGFAYRLNEKTTLRGAYGIMFEGDFFNGPVSPFGTATSLQAVGTYQLAADNVNPWQGIFNWDQGFPTDRYRPATYDVGWGNRNTPARIHPDYGRSPYIQMWNFNIQRQLPKSVVLELGYVANKGTGLRSEEFGKLNQIRPELMQQFGRNLLNPVTTEAQARANGIAYPYPGFRGTVASALREFPQVVGNSRVNSYGAPGGFSTYHSMQVIVNKDFKSGLTAYGNYVWSKNLTNVQSSQVNDNEDFFDQYNLAIEKQIAADDRTHMVKGHIAYDLPFGRGRQIFSGAGRFANALIGGWSVSAIVNYFSGVPLSFVGTNPLPNAWNGGANRLNIQDGVPLRLGSFDAEKFEISSATSPSNTYLNKSAFSDPGPLAIGTAARRPGVRGPAQLNEDFGIQKNIQVTETVRWQLRAEMLNGLNRAIRGNPNVNVNSPQFGQITGTSGPRNVQVSMRVDF